MKITDIKIEKLKLELLTTYANALESLEEFTTILIKMETDEGLYGYGEASPMEPITGETPNTVIAALLFLKPLIIGRNPLNVVDIGHICKRALLYNASAKAAIDIALYDIISKWMGLPLYMMLGGARDTFTTDKTIMLAPTDIMVERTVELKNLGFEKIKVKAGLNLEDDYERIVRI